ncbi:MAG TPA: glycosyltransferase [Candidatus Sulfotelmatobacter sp.]|jgi:UDP-N-acetylglucosamine:LPS N-acetylglucosamine transferase|nr:glycosyltransferase [Candidatus Sulfotelmatobacter sp.]
MKKIQIIFHDAGGGHRNAAVALQAMAKAQNRDWEVELIQFQELTDRLDVLRKVTGIRIQEQYNTLLRNGWTLGSEYLLRVLQWTIRIFHGPLVKLLKSFWRTHPADMLISVIPHFNREIAESWERVYPGRPFVTVITDLADFPPRFWIEPVKEQFVIAGTERAVEQARAMGKDDAHVFGVSGMVLRPEFYQESSVDAAAVKKELGLREDLPTAMVLFGGFGSKVMYEIVEKLDAARLPVQLILICGKNEKLAARLKAKKWNVGTSVIGFTKEVHKLMRAADFLIGKPGPGSIAEAMQRGLPVLVECNAWTLPQERFNAEWVTEKRVGVVLKSFDDVVSGVRQMLQPAKLAEFRKNVAAQNNRAIFEIMEILERLLAPESAQTEKEIAAAPASVR